MGFTFDNLPRDYETLQVPTFILKGRSSANDSGIIGVFNDKFPDQFYEVTKGFFKLYLHLGKGINKIKIKHLQGQFGSNGYAGFNPTIAAYDETEITLNYSPIPDSQFHVPKVHLCVMVARDSPGLFDCPSDKLYEGNGLETAVRKLRVGGRLMQAFTQDEMNKAGLGNRCFRFVEEETYGTTSFQDELTNTKREEIKIHIIRSNHTVAEIRDPNFAQQNRNATEAGKLFDFALEALRESGGPFSEQETNNTPAIAAVMILDAHWDKQQGLITGHAALGGGTDRIKLAIFGSQGLHSFPMNWESVHKSFTDCTPLNINEVANDCNECSQYWECLTVALGAFMHEIGHSLGCPHQEHGVMLRDYVTMNRKFLTTERNCVRTKRGEWGPVSVSDEPGWHRLDMLRFLYHPAFTLSSDFQDPSFKPQYSYMNQGMKFPSTVSTEPTFIAVDNDTLEIASETGVYSIECVFDDLARMHYEFLPKGHHGNGPQKMVRLSYKLIQKQLRSEYQGRPLKLEVLSMGFGQRSIDNLQDFLAEHSKLVCLSNGKNARSSGTFGNNVTNKIESVFPANSKILKFRISFGAALDGIQTFFEDGSSMTFGNNTNSYDEFTLDGDEFVTCLAFRSGAWVDSIQIFTNKKVSPNYGGNGGGLHKVPLPQGSQLLGLYGCKSNWIDQIGFYYGN